MAGIRSGFPWSPYSRLNARWNGRKDGRKGIPPLDQAEHAPYEMQLKQVGEENIKRVAQAWDALDERLKAEYCAAKGAHVAGLRGLPDVEVEHRRAAAEHEASRQTLRHAPGNVELGPVAYGVIIAVIAIGEFPLNALVFRLFGEAEVMTYLMSATLAVVLPLCGHMLGILLKGGLFRDGRATREAGLAILMAIGAIAVILAIGYLRETYVEALGVQRLLGIRMDPAKVTLVFFAINLLIFLAATLASYLAHDPSVRRAKKDLKAATKRLGRAQRRLAEVRAMSEGAVRRFQEARARRETLWEKKGAEAAEIKDIVQRQIEVYRTHNLRVRGAPTMPKSFTNYPEVKVPAVLEELDWNCPGLEAGGPPDPAGGPGGETPREAG